VTTILLAFPGQDFTEEHVALVQAQARGMQVIRTREREEIEAVLDEVEIAAGRVPYDLVLRAPRLRWLQLWSAGANWLMRHPEASERPFVLTNASGVHSVPISEHILAFLLAFSRDFPGAWRAQSERRWERQHHVFELAGKTLLLVGVGAIGERTAQVASGLGLRVWGVRRNPEIAVPHVERMGGMEDLETWLPLADLVVLTIPLTAETQHAFGEDQLRRMKTSAYLVNIGRGQTVDEPALIKALKEGWIAGVGLDVFEAEPLPAESPLWSMPNVLITAHYSGSTPAYHARALDIFLDNLNRYHDGHALRNVVDKQIGY